MKKRALFPVTACAVILCLLSLPPAMAAKKQMNRVRIVIQRCNDEPCYYGLGVHRN